MILQSQMTCLINANSFATTYIQLMSSEFLTLPRNDSPCATSDVELLEPEIKAGWCCNHHFENNPKPAGRPLQSGGAATVRWETQHFGLEAAGDTETPRRLEMWGQSRPQWRGPKHADTGCGTQILQQFFNQFALDLQQAGIEHVIEKAVYHWISMKFIPSVEQLLAAFWLL